jgi:hypothetical protein
MNVWLMTDPIFWVTFGVWFGLPYRALDWRINDVVAPSP